jgi:excisionase family DNA binding protein
LSGLLKDHHGGRLHQLRHADRQLSSYTTFLDSSLLRYARYRERMIMTLQAGERLMSLTDVSEMLGIPVHTLYRWRSKGDGPVGYRVGRHVRYRREAVEAWLEQQADER